MKKKAKKMFETGFGNLAKIAKELNISYNTLKSWKNRDDLDGNFWLQPKKNKKETKLIREFATKPSPQKLAIAKKMVVSGETISSVSKKLGVSKSTLMRKSSEEGWVKKRKRFLEKMYERLLEKVGDKHFKNREEAFEFLSNIRKKLMEISETADSDNPLSKDLMTAYLTLIKAIKESVETEASLIGVTSVEHLLDGDLKERKLELDINKSKEDENSNEKIISSLDKLEVVLNKVGGTDEN